MSAANRTVRAKYPPWLHPDPVPHFGGFCYIDVMITPETKCRWFCPTPGYLLIVLLVVEGFLLLSEWRGWFSRTSLNEKPPPPNKATPSFKGVSHTNGKSTGRRVSARIPLDWHKSESLAESRPRHFSTNPPKTLQAPGISSRIISSCGGWNCSL